MTVDFGAQVPVTRHPSSYPRIGFTSSVWGARPRRRRRKLRTKFAVFGPNSAVRIPSSRRSVSRRHDVPGRREKRTRIAATPPANRHQRRVRRCGGGTRRQSAECGEEREGGRRGRVVNGGGACNRDTRDESEHRHRVAWRVVDSVATRSPGRHRHGPVTAESGVPCRGPALCGTRQCGARLRVREQPALTRAETAGAVARRSARSASGNADTRSPIVSTPFAELLAVWRLATRLVLAAAALVNRLTDVVVVLSSRRFLERPPVRYGGTWRTVCGPWTFDLPVA